MSVRVQISGQDIRPVHTGYVSTYDGAHQIEIDSHTHLFLTPTQARQWIEVLTQVAEAGESE